jgi:UDP-N-acetylglucosamine:LPS N-acetylglucosamine transferase
MAQVAGWVAEHRPRLLVVDVSVEVALLARLCGVPTVVVALPGTRLDPPHRLAYDSAEALLAPWPEGVHTRDWPSSWRQKVRCFGGISRFDGRPAAPLRLAAPRPRHQVLVLWGSGGRSAGSDAVAAARAATPDWEWLERDPASSPSPDLWAELCAADVVVSHAGQNAVAEVAAARRPAVVIAQARPFGEQEATAAAVHRLGAAVGLEQWPPAAEWPALLERAVGLGGSGWDRWTTGGGAAAAARHLETLAGRVGAKSVA